MWERGSGGGGGGGSGDGDRLMNRVSTFSNNYEQDLALSKTDTGWL
jgi:hypothetical protein